jgi:hypothetical protein
MKSPTAFRQALFEKNSKTGRRGWIIRKVTRKSNPTIKSETSSVQMRLLQSPYENCQERDQSRLESGAGSVDDSYSDRGS